MFKKFLRICSTILTLVMLVNMLPLNAWAVGSISESSLELSANDTVTSGEQTDIDLSNAWIVEEVTANRTEYSKEFKLNNGLYVAAVYPQAVHYETATGWEEIDNTLKANLDGTYSNTAGTWDVRFPQQLSGSKDITITKDGYTLSFRMAGELRQQPNVSVYAVQSAAPAETFQITVDGTAQTFAVQSAQTAHAQIQAIDLTQAKAEAQYAEFVLDKNASQLLYANVYANTNIRYDLHANRVKESVILASYSSTLRGYRYTLNTGGMIPVLQKDNSIHFYDAKQENVVMVMPAPFLVDANDQYNYDVKVTLTGSGSSYTLIYTLPNAWLASAERAWPVVLDPEVTTQPDVLNIRDHSVASNGSYSMYRTVLECGYGPSNHIHHIYLKYRDLPALTSADVIIKAEISLLKLNNTANDPIYMEAHKVLGTWESETITWANKPGHNEIAEDVQYIQHNGSTYTWEITDIVREWYAGKNYGVMFKGNAAAESSTNSWKQFYSSDCLVAAQMPSLTITFRNNNGLEDYWDYTATSAGRAGTGYVNNYTGNLVWVRPDMGFDSNRMPVYINHIYSANDSARNDFGLGMGWRTNYNQLVYPMAEGTNSYVWEDADGTKHYFQYNASTGKYKNEEGLNLTLTVNTTSSSGTTYQITDAYENVSEFDSSGRLICQTNNQPEKSSIIITYDGDTKRISTITDGIGRVYRFAYSTSTNLLNRLSCTNTNSSGTSTELTYLTCTYSGNQLTRITDKDGKYVTYGYGSNDLLQTVQNVDGCKLQYTYNTRVSTFEPYRVKQIKELDGTVAGGELNIVYANNQTTLTDVGGNVQIMQFNNFGNTVSIQDDNGNAQTAKYANNDATGTSAAPANQLTLASQLQNTVGNMFKDSSFENGTTWTATASTVSKSTTSGMVYLGNRSLSVTTTASGVGVKSASFTALPGQSYTFSAYILTWTTAAYLALSDGSTTVKSETIAINQSWTRLQVTYTNTKSYSVTITAQCIASGTGTFYVDCVQLENAVSASRYNLIENGDFRYGLDGWTNTGGYTLATRTSAAEQLDNNVCKVTGNNQLGKRLVQTLDMLGEEGDIYTLTGWAMGDSIPLSGFREFAILVTVDYLYEDPEQFVAQFNPDSDSANGWQYTAVEFVAAADYQSITIEIAYDYNLNTVYFDGIQLYKEALGATYEYDSNGNLTKYRDVLGQVTTYTYNSKDQLIEEVRPDGEVLTYRYNTTYPNLTAVTSSRGTVQTYGYTPYGNCSRITTTVDDITVTEEYLYSSDRKEFLQIKRTSLGEELIYLYDRNTGLLTEVSPNETTSTRYTYDSMYRLTGEQLVCDEGIIFVHYGYENDQLSTAQTASTIYTFSYGNFSQISQIKAGSHTLATYHYNDETTNDRKNDLDRIDYGNGDRVEYKYDDQGRVIEEHYTKTNSNNTTTDYGTIYYTYNSDGSLASVYDDYLFGSKYSYFYDSFGRVTQVLRDRRTITTYTYTADNLLFRVDDASYGTTTYTYDQNQRLSSETNNTAQKTYTYSPGGMLEGTAIKSPANTDYTVLTQNFEYYNNSSGSDGMLQSYEVSAAHYSRTLSYAYDNRGNITSIVDGIYTTSYEYDEANQLVRENNQREGKTWVWEYDNAGNILYKKEYDYTTDTLSGNSSLITYTYGDSSWGDLLTGYGNRTITYDEIGNPLNDGLRTYTWERGRRVASINGAAMYYDSNGMLQVQSAGNNWYGYTYREGRLTEFDIEIGSNEYSMIIDYDASGTPLSLQCTAWYYDVDTGDEASYTDTYYYLVNPQGDVIGLTNSRGDLIVSYNYDAWGKLLSWDCGRDNSTMECDVAVLNPLRYRGYIYDVESGLYYLKSRFYDPEMGRFINADEFVSTGQDLQGYNMFAYCGNNPVVRKDESGYFWNTVIGAVAGAIVGGISAALSGTDITAGIVSGALSGAISGAAVDIAIATGGVGLVALAGVALASGAGGAASSYVNQRMNGRSHDEVDWGAVAIDGIWGAVGGALSFGTADVGGKMCKTLAENLALKGKAFWSQAASDFATTITIAAGTWLNGTKMNLLRQGKATVASVC